MSRSLAPVLLALLAPLAFVRPALAEESPADALMTGKGPAIVSLKFVQKSADAESSATALGVVIDPSGFVMLADADLGGAEEKVVDLKALFGNDPQEWEAVVVARDKSLSLAYVQILGLAGKTLASVDLAAAAEPRVGGDYFGVWREGRGFDYATAHGRVYVTGKVEKPRAMWGVGGEFAWTGLPVFDAAGKVVGVLASQESSAGASEEDGTDTKTFLLPLADVRKSAEQAKKRVADVVAKAEAAKQDAAGEAKPDAPKAPEGPKAPEAPKAPEQPK